MRAYEFLSRLRSLDTIIAEAEARVETLEQKLLPQGIQYDGIKVQTSGDADPFTDKMIELIDARRAILDTINADLKAKKEVDDVVRQLDPREIELVYYRFRDLKTFAEISDKMNYSYSQVRRIYKRSLKKVEAILNERGKKDF